MPELTRAERIDQFDLIIAKCDQEIERSRRKDGQNLQARKETAQRKIETLLHSSIFTQEDDLIQTWERLKTEGFPVSSVTTLPPGYKENAGQSKDWYKSEDIFCILDKEMESRPGVKFSNMVLVGERQDYGKGKFDPKKAFKSQLRGALKNAKSGQPTIMPINLRNKHWVAGMLRENEEGELEFLYYDSMDKDIDPKLEEWIKEIGDVKIVNLRDAKQQTDGYNCGPYMVHNLLKFADNPGLAAEELKKELGAPNPVTLREEHAKILAGNKFERDEVQEMWDEVKRRAICGKMVNMFEQFQEEKRKKGDTIECKDDEEAKNLAEQIKKSYEDLGVVPCVLKQNGGNWVVRLPDACQGKDPFSMNSDELGKLRERLQSPSPSVFTKTVERAKSVEQEQSASL